MVKKRVDSTFTSHVCKGPQYRQYPDTFSIQGSVSFPDLCVHVQINAYTKMIHISM